MQGATNSDSNGQVAFNIYAHALHRSSMFLFQNLMADHTGLMACMHAGVCVHKTTHQFSRIDTSDSKDESIQSCAAQHANLHPPQCEGTAHRVTQLFALQLASSAVSAHVMQLLDNCTEPSGRKELSAELTSTSKPDGLGASKTLPHEMS